MSKLRFLAAIAAVVVASQAMPHIVRADGWGSITGQFVLKEDVPTIEPLVKKGDPAARDAAVCAAQDVPNDAMAINSENKGIGNVVIFMRSAKKVHPDLQKSKEATVEFDQKGCRFIPHALVVRTDQKVVCKSSDQVSHNVNIGPLFNSPANFIIQPGDSEGVEVSMPLKESLPVTVKCDIHPWMTAWWVVVDHPYAAITDADGKFTIENLPEGENEFRVWQEKVGYVNKSWKVTVKAGQMTTLEPVEVPLSSFSD